MLGNAMEGLLAWGDKAITTALPPSVNPYMSAPIASKFYTLSSSKWRGAPLEPVERIADRCPR
jgi:hypothetical protein